VDDRLHDALSRLVAAIQTRRTAIRNAASGAVALAFGAGPDGAEARNRHRNRKRRQRRRRRRRHQCKGGTSRCGLACVDLQNDPDNCGRCDRECDAGEACRVGVCGCDVCDDEDACPFQTLQAAVDAAGPNSMITICKGEYDGNVVIGKNLSLVGAGPDDTELEGEGAGSVVTIAQSAVVTIRGVTISGGAGTLDDGLLMGGGVFNEGTLTLIDSAIVRNRADQGGGILNSNAGTLTLDGVAIAQNESDIAGGILNLPGGDLTISNGSTIAGNRADITSGGIHNGGLLSVSGSTIRDNHAEDNGGGMINDLGGLATLSATRVADNTSGRNGGGLFIVFGLVTLENGSLVTQNTAAENGGGVFNESANAVIISGSAIRDNNAE
jgi:hypothetical protein